MKVWRNQERRGIRGGIKVWRTHERKRDARRHEGLEKPREKGMRG